MKGIEGGIREIREEIGWDLDTDKLIYMGKRINWDDDPKRGIINREFQDIYFSEFTGGWEDFHLRSNEIAGIVKIKTRDLIQIFNFWTPEAKIRDVEGLFLRKTNVSYFSELW